MDIKCPCGDIDCEIYDGNAYPGRVIHCRLLSSRGKKKTGKTNKDVTSDKELSVLTDFIVKKSGLMAMGHSKAKEHKLAIERAVMEEKSA